MDYSDNKIIFPMSKPAIHFFCVIFLAVIFLNLFNLSMQKPLDHDEHQFVASGALLAREGVMFYQDYPYFHMPYLTFVYAGIYCFSNKLLLSARVFSILCSFLSICVIFFLAFFLLKKFTLLDRLLISMSSILLLISSPLFVHTTGLAWNHDFPMLLLIVSFVLYSRGVKQNDGVLLIAASGFLLGIATGVRLSFAPLFVPYFLLPLVYKKSIHRKRLKELFAQFTLGSLLALLPALYIFLQNPEQFFFGNFGYPELNTAFRTELGYSRSMDLFSKLLYTLEMIFQPGNLLVFGAAGYFAFRKQYVRIAINNRSQLEIIFILLILPFLLLGTYAPTPSFKQYFYPPLVFALLAIIWGILYYYNTKLQSLSHLKIIGVVIIINCLYSLPQYPDPVKIVKTKQWMPLQIHEIGKKLAEEIGEGHKVLTLAPIVPLEGGLKIYKEFTTGPFAWRTASGLPTEGRKKFNMISNQELASVLKTDVPAAILLGFEFKIEERMLQYAKEHNFIHKELLNNRKVWVPANSSILQ